MIQTKLLILVFLSGLLTLSCSTNENKKANNPIDSETEVASFERNPKDVVTVDDVKLEVYDFENFEPFTKRMDNKIHIINFWATWCIPCVKELPYFEQLSEKYPTVEILLVSMDFSTKIESDLIPFIQKNKLKSEVIMLHEPDGNSWIPKIDPNWSGAIPATIIYKNDKVKFYEQSFTFEELETEYLKFTK